MASGPLKPPHPPPSLLLYSSASVEKIVSPALGKEESFQTTRFIWDVPAPSPCPLPVPCLAWPAPGRMPPRVCKAVQACPSEVAQSSQCHRHHVVFRRLAHWSGMQRQPMGLAVVSAVLGSPERHVGSGVLRFKIENQALEVGTWGLERWLIG